MAEKSFIYIICISVSFYAADMQPHVAEPNPFGLVGCIHRNL